MEFLVKGFEELTKAELYEILKVRSEIFIVEQKMNCQDMDGVDFNCLHMFLKDGENIVAYLRAFKNPEDQTAVKIGRVLSLYHGKGLGTELLKRCILEIKNHFFCEKITLHSQKSAVAFYEKLGFKITSDEFMEEGVVHQAMEYIL